MAPHLTDKEREQIIAYLQDGKSQNWTAKKVKRSVDTVGKIGRANGIEPLTRSTKKAVQVSAKVREINRMEIIGGILTTGQSLLDGVADAKDYKDVVTGLAIGIDKHRLETGDVTDRTERVDAEARNRVRSKLDELAQRRDDRDQRLA